MGLTVITDYISLHNHMLKVNSGLGYSRIMVIHGIVTYVTKLE
jgi:hypothetical protein